MAYIMPPLSAICAALAFANGHTLAGAIWVATFIVWTIAAAAEHPLGRVPVITPIWERMRDGIETAYFKLDAWISRKVNR